MLDNGLYNIVGDRGKRRGRSRALYNGLFEDVMVGRGCAGCESERRTPYPFYITAYDVVWRWAPLEAARIITMSSFCEFVASAVLVYIHVCMYQHPHDICLDLDGQAPIGTYRTAVSSVEHISTHALSGRPILCLNCLETESEFV